jgi:hypothetical protein
MKWFAVASLFVEPVAAGSHGGVSMISYSCDLCKRNLDPEQDLRYVVKIEISAAFDPISPEEEESDRDHLEEIQDILQRLEDGQCEEISEDVFQQLRFDLCPECRKRFAKNPLGREAAKLLGFSKN